MKNVRPPQFLGNLYRDMRDRHMLLPAILLLVALLAVPVLLKSQAATSAPPPPSDTSDRSASAAVPAVVTHELGITDYRKRLDQLNSKNPFHQQYMEPTKSAELNATSSGGGGGSDASSSGTGGSADTSTSPSISTTPGNGASPSVSSSPPSSTSSSPPANSGGGQPEFHLYTYRVAVKIGEPGKLADRPEVSSLALLPSKSRPILSFLEANGKQALFLVSKDVDSVKGDGRCVPKPSNCGYILMRPGDKASFSYAPNGKRYNLVLVDIHAAEIGNKPPTKDKKASGKDSLEAKLPLLGLG